jgi:hypothetical protein
MASDDALALLDSLCSRAHAEAVEAFGLCALSALAGSAADADLSDFALESGASAEPVFRAVKRVLADALSHEVSDAKFLKVLGKLGLSERSAAGLGRALKARRGDTIAQVRTNAVRAVADTVMTGFDWSVHHVVASDRLHSMGESSVSVSLHLQNSGSGAPAQTAVFELSAPELDALIHSLERAVGDEPTGTAAAPTRPGFSAGVQAATKR